MSMNPTFRVLAPRMMRDLMRDFAPLADFQAAGAVGNGGGETSGFTKLFEEHPTIAGSKGGSGMFQWTGMTSNNPRRRNWEVFLRSRGLDPNKKNDVGNYDANYAFLKKELQSSERATIPALRKTQNLSEATTSFMATFERPGIPNIKGRIGWAQGALEAFRADQGKVIQNVPTSEEKFVIPGQVATDAKVDGVPKPKNNNKGFWGTILAGAGAAATSAWHYAVAALPWVIGIVGVVLLFIYVIRPAWVRYRDYLSQAPEFKDLMDKSPWEAFKVLFNGLKTKMIARFTTATGAIILALQGAQTFASDSGTSFTDFLPHLHIPILNTDVGPGMYVFGGVSLLGMLNEWLRSVSPTKDGTIDAQTAVSMAASSDSVVGVVPSPALAAVTDPSGLLAIASNSGATTRVSQTRKKIRKSKTSKRKKAA